MTDDLTPQCKHGSTMQHWVANPVFGSCGEGEWCSPMTDNLTLIREVYKLIYFTKPIPAAEIVALVESALRAKIADEIAAYNTYKAGGNDSFNEGYLDGLAAAEIIADPSRARTAHLDPADG